MPKTDRFPFRSDVRAKLIDVATQGRTTEYLELGVGRAMVGRYLARIAAEEQAAGRPPLTAVVVRRDTGRPGEGFLQAMEQVGYIVPGAEIDERALWVKVLREVHAYWRPKLGDDLSPL